jgi:hypothetical protein
LNYDDDKYDIDDCKEVNSSFRSINRLIEGILTFLEFSKIYDAFEGQPITMMAWK